MSYLAQYHQRVSAMTLLKQMLSATASTSIQYHIRHAQIVHEVYVFKTIKYFKGNTSQYFKTHQQIQNHYQP